ncbi:uncharacterized protein LOC114813266 [Ornithorhynchus anatinus]|uniref:uncharacterized protein LOC114813266 n=1 Tax=Ornithorhynchus anatinus TaxID=9258 RepID=UPI0010A7614A|nr:uncharacterized protein LOC114813266 [Ornithorhynchus anatinus]
MIAVSLMALRDEQRAIRTTVLQNRMALDFLLASQGGVSKLIGKECCTFIPDNSGHVDAIVADMYHAVNQYQDDDTAGGVWDWFQGLFKNWGSSLFYGLLLLLLLLVGLVGGCWFIGCCCSVLSTRNVTSTAVVHDFSLCALLQECCSPPVILPTSGHHTLKAPPAPDPITPGQSMGPVLCPDLWIYSPDFRGQPGEDISSLWSGEGQSWRARPPASLHHHVPRRGHREGWGQMGTYGKGQWVVCAKVDLGTSYPRLKCHR